MLYTDRQFQSVYAQNTKPPELFYLDFEFFFKLVLDRTMAYTCTL